MSVKEVYGNRKMEIRTAAEFRAAFPSCPREIAEKAVALAVLRKKEHDGVITRSQATQAEKILLRKLDDLLKPMSEDEARRERVRQYGELIRLDAAFTLCQENRAEDPEDVDESDDELQFSLRCPACSYDGEDSPMSYNDASNSLDIRCARCGRSYNVSAMSQEEVSSLRKRAREIQHRQIERSKLPECLRGK